jgi:Holliday junction resolvase RusA-like endonuclease
MHISIISVKNKLFINHLINKVIGGTMSEIINPIIFDESLKGKNCIYFEVPGEPFAKQRPRAVRRGRFVTIYTPNETKLYEKKVLSYFNRSYRGVQLEGDLSVYIEGVFGIPKSTPKSKISAMENNEIPHNKKPDCDNMAKICLDALNTVAYQDDSQISTLNINKRFGKEPKIKIFIKEN